MRNANRRLALAVVSLLCASAQPGSAALFQEFRAAGERIGGQSSSPNSSTTVTSPGFLGVENAMSVVSRVGLNVNADAGPASAAVEVGIASYEVAFAFFHTQSFDLILDFELRGQLLRLAEQAECIGSISLSDIEIPTLVRLRDGAAFPIDVVLEGETLEIGGTTSGIEVAREVRVTINFRDEPVGTDAYRMTFTAAANAFSQSCEVSARFGAGNGSTTDCDACGYPGFGERAQAEDGIFVTVTKISLCGDGTVFPGEECDLGNANGDEGSCCSEFCEHVFAGRVCRPAASDCDVPEACSGEAGVCPDDLKKSLGSFCTSDGNDCTDDVCNDAAQCVHPILEGASCQNQFFCDGGEFCSPQGECITLEPPPCRAGQTCDEANDTCIGAAPTATSTPNGTATATPSASATATASTPGASPPTATATSATPGATPPTATVTAPPATSTATAPSAAATPTATAASAACSGDCNGDRVVAINELVLGVNIALGNQAVAACRAFDGNGDGGVAINELIAGVRSALGACPM